MAGNVTPRIKVPTLATVGEIVTVKTLINHPMETGHRPGAGGSLIPRAALNRLVVTFNGQTVIDADLSIGIAANPYFEFQVRIPEAGEFLFRWHDEDSSVHEERAWIDVA